MIRITTLALLLCCTLAGQAQQLPEAPTPQTAPTRDPAWERVESLPQDAAIDVLERGRGITSCRLDHADDTALFCIPYGPPRRLVFPRREIDSVWEIRMVQTPGWAPFIAIGAITGIFSIIGGTQNGAHGAGTGALIGLLVSSGFAVAIASHDPGPPHRQRHLVYRVSRTP